MIAIEKYTTERVTSTHLWAPNLLSVRVTRPAAYRFVAGQFARLGLQKSAPLAGADALAWRAYSIVSGTQHDCLEFCSVLVPTGEFTSELARVAPGSPILVEKASFGFLTTERFVREGDLWLLATGTGLAPFISILYDDRHWREFRNLIIVHSVRFAAELAYQDTMREISAQAMSAGAPARLTYIPIVTREPGASALVARIPELIANGGLEAAAGLTLEAGHSRVMLCGNPEMISAARALLAVRGFATSRRGQPGTLAIENYW